jgi:hypothetical protein
MADRYILFENPGWRAFVFKEGCYPVGVNPEKEK